MFSPAKTLLLCLNSDLVLVAGFAVVGGTDGEDDDHDEQSSTGGQDGDQGSVVCCFLLQGNTATWGFSSHSGTWVWSLNMNTNPYLGDFLVILGCQDGIHCKLNIDLFNFKLHHPYKYVSSKEREELYLCHLFPPNQTELCRCRAASRSGCSFQLENLPESACTPPPFLCVDPCEAINVKC